MLFHSNSKMVVCCSYFKVSIQICAKYSNIRIQTSEMYSISLKKNGTISFMCVCERNRLLTFHQSIFVRSVLSSEQNEKMNLIFCIKTKTSIVLLHSMFCLTLFRCVLLVHYIYHALCVAMKHMHFPLFSLFLQQCCCY